jgi:hypothetical protein
MNGVSNPFFIYRNIIEFEKPSKTMEFLRHQVELEIANAAYRIIPEEE